jgi:hypothetical protein
MPHLRNITRLGATCAIFHNWPQALIFLVMVTFAVVAASCFLRWFTNLTAARRTDILRLIAELRRR